MATFKFEGLDKYIAQIEKLQGHARGQIKMAVYDGAKVVRDAILPGMHNIPVQDEFVPKHHTRQGITQAEKDAIERGFGIAKMRETGFDVSTKIGWQGAYRRMDKDGTAKYVPISTLVRQIESGTSWLHKDPFVRKAVTQSKSAAEAAMQARLEEEINKITGGN